MYSFMHARASERGKEGRKGDGASRDICARVCRAQMELSVAAPALVKRALGDGGGVPRYLYAICMEENTRVPVYNLAAADGRTVGRSARFARARECAMLTKREREKDHAGGFSAIVLLLVNILCRLSRSQRRAH